jgi:hypothetical protein
LGFVDVTTDANGTAALSFTSPSPFATTNRVITATASVQIDLDGNAQTPLVPLDTSEFSRGVIVTGETLLGDLNEDGVIDAQDIDLLAAAIRAGNSNLRFDLNGSGTVDSQDHAALVHDILETTFGDANLDKRFDSGDLIAVFQPGEYEDAVPGNSGWATGDWNGDGDFDTADLVAAFQEGSYDRAAMTIDQLFAAAALVARRHVVAR